MIETEVKIRLSDPHSIRLKLQIYSIEQDRHFEDNQLFDRDHQLKDRGQALRVRSVKGQHLLTFKGPVQPAPDGIKRRTEWECTVSDAAILGEILFGIGFQPIFRYQKFRTVFRFDDQTQIMFDETPMGFFLEIEGSETSIQGALEHLGLNDAPRELRSYPKLFEQEFGPNRDMIFEGT